LRLAHLSCASRRMVVLTLLFLGVVGLHRTWDLRSYAGDALALLSGGRQAYGYFSTERMLSQLAQAKGDEALTDALAAWTVHLWHAPVQAPSGESAAFCIDGHRKPVYTLTLIPRGLLGLLSTSTQPPQYCWQLWVAGCYLNVSSCTAASSLLTLRI
jgi:hypothetical protein